MRREAGVHLHDSAPSLRTVPGTNLWRSLFEQRLLHVEDMVNTSGPAHANSIFRVIGVRTLLSVPMLHEGRAVGLIVVYRFEVRPFGQEQIDLLTTFANQAVDRDTERAPLQGAAGAQCRGHRALEQQTATSEILKVISSSP